MRLRLQLVLIIAVLLAAAFGVGGTVLISDSFTAALDTQVEDALRAYETLRGTLELVNGADAHRSVADTLKQLQSQSDAPWTALRCECEGARLYESGSGAFSDDLPEAQEGQIVSMVCCEQGEWFLQAESVLRVNGESCLLRARFAPIQAFALRERMIGSFLRIYAVVMALGLALALLTAMRLTVPLQRLTRAARGIAGGDLSKRAHLRGSGEIALLAQDFDRMADRLCENIRTLEQEMERQESFMGAFAHELKTPMTAIIGYADLLRQDALEGEDRIRAARYIYSEGQRLEALSFKLLDLLMLRRSAFGAPSLRLRTLLDEVKQSVEPAVARSGVALLVRCGDAKVRVEPELTKALLINLIDNALKASERGGSVIVACEAFRGGVRLSVEDHGRGMEQSELARITEAFYRVDKARSRAQGGSGLGLTLCREIVALHRGTMRFDSAPNAGTTVTVVLHSLRKPVNKKSSPKKEAKQ